MAHERPAIDLNAGDVPDLAELAEEIHRTKQPRVIRRADEELAVIAFSPRFGWVADRFGVSWQLRLGDHGPGGSASEQTGR